MMLDKNLKRICIEKKISISELARRTGIRQSTLHGWCTSRKVQNIDDLKKVADELEVSIHMLLYGKPDPHETLGQEILKEIFSGDIRVTLHKIEKTKK